MFISHDVRIKPSCLFLGDDGRLREEKKCGGVAERRSESTQALRKHARYRQRRRALAIWLRGDAGAASPTSFLDFSKMFTFLPPFHANTVRMRRRRDADAFESLLTLISAAPSSYAVVLVSAPKSPTAFSRCFFGGCEQPAAAANEIIADVSAATMEKLLF